jgi:hypothetical protein
MIFLLIFLGNNSDDESDSDMFPELAEVVRPNTTAKNEPKPQVREQLQVGGVERQVDLRQLGHDVYEGSAQSRSSGCS